MTDVTVEQDSGFLRGRTDEQCGAEMLSRIHARLDELGRGHPAVRALVAVLDGHRSRGTTGDAYECDPADATHRSCHLDGPHCDHSECISWPCEVVTTIDRELTEP